MPDTMSAPFYNLSDAAEKIGISRQTLYETYLEDYKPVRIAGHPVLTAEQVKAIKAEVKRRRNNKVKEAQAAA